MRKIIVSSLIAIMLGVVAGRFFLNQQEKNVKCIMNASREEYTLEEGVESADAVVEVQVGDMVAEIDDSGLPQTIYEVQVVDVIKGDLPEKIEILQDGTKAIPMGDNPIFEKGERYILMIKKATLSRKSDNLYWIIKEYFVSGEQAVETLPTGEESINQKTLVVEEENTNTKIEEKKEELPYETDTLNKEELVTTIEEMD